MVEVKWSDHAMERMREQTHYIAEQSCSAEIAWNWATDVFAEADSLAEFPNIGHKLPEFRVFFRMRKRHLLPALHDGMQGDEDGMQTCERPPLWAFGWPRGGVHMFTSLHVACLARVA